VQTFMQGNGVKVDLEWNSAEIVAVQLTQWKSRHAYSILVDSHFVATKNYTRSTWTGFDTAIEALESLTNKDIVFVKLNTLPSSEIKEVKEWWVKYYSGIPEKTHKIKYFRQWRINEKDLL